MNPNPSFLAFKSKEEAIGRQLYETLKPKPRTRSRAKRGGKKRPNHLASARSPKATRKNPKPKYLTRYRLVGGKEELEFRGSLYLYANNTKARVQFGRAFLDTLRRPLQSPRDKNLLRCPIYLVTFTLKRFCCSVEEAKDYDLRPLQAWVRQQMEGLSYLGMVEAAFYSNFNVQTGLCVLPDEDEAKKVKTSERNRGQTISWHVHLLVWGVPRAVLKALVDEVSAKHPSLVPGLPSADYRLIPPEHFDGKILYILKSPREYRVWLKKREETDPDTGEITVQPTERYRQKSRRLRRGDGVRMFQVMHDRYLDGMMLGGGAGRYLLRSIRKEALQPLRCRMR
jgi:hypothetical protein